MSTEGRRRPAPRQSDRRPRQRPTPVKCRQNAGRFSARAGNLAHIHACNDAIPGEEMSEKLSRLELIVSRIFAQVEQHPDLADDLHKMMSYYLPTTRKLIDAYVDLDNQPVEGSNIANTKKEIEHTLDTINQAFELLLDSLFQDKAWDISSDISVLNTMLAQEGLTKRDFS